MRYVGVLIGVTMLVAGCGAGDQSAAADTTGRDLTMAAPESTAALSDVPSVDVPKPPEQRAQLPRPRRQPTPAEATERPRPPAPLSLAAGTSFGAAVSDTITSRTATAGEVFTATVGADVSDAGGRVVIPAGSRITGVVVEVRPAPNPNETGTMRLAVSSVNVRGTDYPIDAMIDSVATERQGRGVTGGDAAKVGAGAAAGAIVGRVIGKDTKGAVIGGVVGAAVGAGVAAGTKDADIVVPAGSRIVIRLTAPLRVPVG